MNAPLKLMESGAPVALPIAQDPSPIRRAPLWVCFVVAVGGSAALWAGVVILGGQLGRVLGIQH